MMTKWRVIKKAVQGEFSYVGLEFNLNTGILSGVSVRDSETSVRKRSTSQFEGLENGEWIDLPSREAPSLIKDFNRIRKAEGLDYITEQEVLKLLYQINNL